MITSPGIVVHRLISAGLFVTNKSRMLFLRVRHLTIRSRSQLFAIARKRSESSLGYWLLFTDSTFQSMSGKSRSPPIHIAAFGCGWT